MSEGQTQSGGPDAAAAATGGITVFDDELLDQVRRSLAEEAAGVPPVSLREIKREIAHGEAAEDIAHDDHERGWTSWFIDRRCPDCTGPLATNGRREWCAEHGISRWCGLASVAATFVPPAPPLTMTTAPTS